MSISSLPQNYASFVMVTCPCGRVLRARQEQVGSSIACWDCQTLVLVEMPRSRVRAFETILIGVRDFARSTYLNRVAYFALGMTLAMSVPYAGVGLAVVVLAAALLFYGDLVDGDASIMESWSKDWRRVLLGVRPMRVVLSLLFAAGTVVPLWLMGGGVQQSPHITRLGGAILALTWSVGPAAFFISRGSRGDDGSLVGLKRKTLLQYPMMFLLLLTIPPLSLVAIETLIGTVLAGSGSLLFYTFDLMIVPGHPDEADGYLYYQSVAAFEFMNSSFASTYPDGLRRGFSFVSSVPPSLSLPTRYGLNPLSINIDDIQYFLIRMGMTFAIVVSLGFGLIVQGRCLGLLWNAQMRTRP